MRRSFILICVALFLSMFANAQSPTITFSNLADKYAPGFPADVTMRLNSNGCDVDQLCMISYEIKRNGVVVENIEDYGSVRYGVRLASDSIIYRDVTSGHGLMSISVTYDGVDYNVNAFTLGIFDSNSCVNRNRPVEVWTKFDSIGTYTIEIKLYSATPENEVYVLQTGTSFVDCNAVEHTDAIVAPGHVTESEVLATATETVNVVPSYAITFEGLNGFEVADVVTALPPARVDSIMQGDDYVFSIEAECRTINSVIVGEQTLTATDGKYTVANVQSDTTITVVFDTIRYTVTATAGENGSVAEGFASQNVDCGANCTVTFVPSVGYVLDKVFVNEEELTEGLSGNSVVLQNVRENLAVSATFAEAQNPTITFTQVDDKYAPGFPADAFMHLNSNGRNIDQLCMLSYEVKRNGVIVEDIADFGSVRYGVRLAGDSVIYRDITNGSGFVSISVNYDGEDYDVNAFTLGIFDANECVNRNRPVEVWATFDSIGEYTIEIKLHSAIPESDVYVLETGTSFVDCNAVEHNDAIVAPGHVTAGDVLATATETVNVVPSYAITFVGLDENDEVTALPPARVDSIMQGDDYVFSITPSQCKTVASVTVGEETLTATEGMYTIANVQSDTTITVAFDIIKHTLTMTAGANGSVAESEAEVDCGTDYTVTFVPNSGYKLGAVTLDGEPVTEGISGNSYTISNVLADHTIHGEFIEFRGPYAEYVNLESNYEVGDTIDFSVKMHANCMYENLCAVGYELIYWNTDTTSIVVTDATRYGVFSYNVNVTDSTFVSNQVSNGSGNITYTTDYGTTTYNVGAFTLGLFDAETGRDRTIDYNMIFTTNGHYQFKTTLYTCANGGDVIGSSFEVANCDDLTHYDRVAETCSNPREANVIVQDINITGATIHTVTATVLGGHGTVSPSGTVIYEAGEDVDVVFTPDEYYALDTVMVNGIMRYPSISGVEYIVDNVYSIENISENYNITVKFKDVRPYYTVHVEIATAGGTVTPKDTSVVIGSDVTLRVSPNDGYHISQLSIDGNIVVDYASNEIIFRDIHEDHEVSISFFPNSVEENMFANLSIYPNPNNGQFTVSSDDFDGDVTFQIFSVSGAMMDERMVNGEKTVSFDKSLPAGTYFLRIIAGEKVATRKVVVE